MEPGQNLLSWANANGVGETSFDRARATRTFANHPLKSGLTGSVTRSPMERPDAEDRLSHTSLCSFRRRIPLGLSSRREPIVSRELVTRLGHRPWMLR